MLVNQMVILIPENHGNHLLRHGGELIISDDCQIRVSTIYTEMFLVFFLFPFFKLNMDLK